MRMEARRQAVADDLRTVYAGLQQLIVPAWLKLDLSMAQFKALVAVEGTPCIGVGGLGRKLSIGESAASLLVDQLVRRGYVERAVDPVDRRRVRLDVTAQGHDRLRELRQGSRGILASWLDELDEDDLDALAQGLKALSEAVSRQVVGDQILGEETTGNPAR
jgi:DNA-binding MarR family transcriptional regulator